MTEHTGSSAVQLRSAEQYAPHSASADPPQFRGPWPGAGAGTDPAVLLSTLTTVLDNLDAAVYASDMETHELLYVNPYVRKAVGSGIKPGARCWQVLQSGLTGPCSFCTNSRLINANGKPAGVHTWEFQNTVNSRWYFISDQAIPWIDGRLVRLEIATDITARKLAEQDDAVTRDLLEQGIQERTRDLKEEIAERKKTEETLRRSEENYRTLVDTMHETMTVLAADGTVLFANARTALNFCNGTPGDVINRNITEFIPPESAKNHIRDYNAVLRESRPLTREVQTVLQGRRRWFLNTLTPVRFGESGQPAVLSMSVDITDRVAAEKSLRESWLRFRQLAENVNEVFWVRDAVTREILYINPAYEAIWGRTCQSMYEHPESFSNSVHPDDAKRVAAAVRKQQDGCPFNEEYRIIRPDNTVRWIWARTFPVRDESGATVRYAGIAEDITERHSAKEKLRDYASRLKSLSRRLVEAQETERRRIAQELHDEIGQSLTMLKFGIAKLDDLVPEKDRSEVEGLRALAGDLMEKVRALSLNLRPSMLDDLGLLPALLWQTETFSQKTGVQVKFQHSGLDRRFPQDVETTAYRIAQEALTNVARHSGAREAALTVLVRDNELLLRIKDGGRGFDPAALPAGGVGAGLSGIRERLEMVGGRLTIDTAPENGALLTAAIPLGKQLMLKAEHHEHSISRAGR
ncbi:MAG: PAS domain S-box protein [Nitrospirota bacterium]|nr:PAS domain S-box protein [Nitrospirota bacterium]